MTPQRSREKLRELLYSRLRLKPAPLLAGEMFVIPGATLWTGSRVWVKRFRELGLVAGDRVAMRLPRTPAFVMATIACWWEGITLCPLPEWLSDDELETALDEIDAKLLISFDDRVDAIAPDPAGAPLEKARPQLRETGQPLPGLALIMSTSGTSGKAKRVALTDENLLNQLETHTDALGINDTHRVLSVLPWHHSFGLLVDLWPALLGGGTVYVETTGGRETNEVLRSALQVEATHLSMVPLMAERLFQMPQGPELLNRVSGVIGGAPIDSGMAEQLRGTRLRIGYGQTEASPGIALGETGEFSPGWLGTPIGCETRVVEGELHVRGPNVCAGLWNHGVEPLSDSTGWMPTGDLVEPAGDGYRFVGRADDLFKLANGRMIDTPLLERNIRSVMRTGECIVGTIDGKSLVVVTIGQDHPSAESIRGALGSAGSLLGRVVSLSDSQELRTRKGVLHRPTIFNRIQPNLPTPMSGTLAA